MKKCQTLLCGKDASYFHKVSKEYKCSTCRNKRGDRESLAWQTLDNQESEEDYLFLPKAKPLETYKISETNCGKYAVTDSEGEIAFFSPEISDVKLVCAALNKAFKLGAESILHSLSTFSLDQRRKLGIFWGEGNQSNH